MFDCHSQHKTDSMEMVCWKRKDFVQAKVAKPDDIVFSWQVELCYQFEYLFDICRDDQQSRVRWIRTFEAVGHVTRFAT